MASRIQSLQLLRRIYLTPARSHPSRCRALSRTSSTVYRPLRYVGDYKQICLWVRRAFQTSICSTALKHYRSSPGMKLVSGCICSLPVGFALISDQSNVSYAMPMNALEILLEDPSGMASDAPEPLTNPNPINNLARKLWLPFLLLFRVVCNLYNPFALITTVPILFLCTKPRPFSIYLEIDKLKREYELVETEVNFQPLYARRVDLEDYIVASIARVQIKDDEFTFIGVLGSWWMIRSGELTYLPKALPVCWNILWGRA